MAAPIDNNELFKKSEQKTLKQQFKFWGMISAFTAVLIVFFYVVLVDAPPPNRIKMTSGDPTGLYYQYAETYAQKCLQHGVTIEVSPSAGSLENLDLLLDNKSGFKAGIVQGGVVANHPENERIAKDLRSLGSLYREPLWLFYRKDSFPDGFTQLSQLAGKRFSAGSPRSGTFPVTSKILGEFDIDVTNPDSLPDDTDLSMLSGSDSAEALVKGEIDAAFMIVGLSKYVKQLLLSDKIDVYSFDNWEVYTRKFSFLSHTTLPRGMVDIKKNVPARTINLVAPVATLVVRKELHSALQILLTMTIDGVHRSGDAVFTKPDEFPSYHFLDIPISSEAERYYRHGPPALQRILGFQWAIWVDRIKLMIIPLLMLMMPLIKMLPPILRWRIRSRIYRWYAVMREADIALKHDSSKEKLLSYVEKLIEIDKEVADVVVPLSYMNEFYNMRVHLAFILDKLKTAINGVGE